MIDLSYLIGNLNKEHGGAQQLLYDICRRLPEDEFDITVYYMFGEGTFQPDFEKADVGVVPLEAQSNYDLRTFRSLIHSLRRNDHDILHTNSPISGAWGRVAGSISSIDSIVSVEHNVHTSYSRYARTVNGLTLPLTDAVVGVTDAVSNSYLRWEEFIIPKSTERKTILNGVNVPAITETFDRSEEVLREFTPYSPSDRIIGSMGRLNEQKGYEYLIRSFARIKEQEEDAKLLLIGDGPEREKLGSIANQTGYESDIHFTGYVPNVYPFLPTFDVAAFPSLWEGFGLTPVEVMAAERPVVGTKIPAFEEVIGDAGVLVEPKNEVALAEAIATLLHDEERCEELAQRGYERATSQLSIERTVEEYAELYRNLATQQ